MRDYKEYKPDEGRSYRAGELLMQCRPLVTALEDPFQGRYCNACCRRKQVHACRGGCDSEHYCSKACSDAAWTLHQHLCRNWKTYESKKLTPNLTLAAKLIVWLKNGGDKQWIKIDDKLSRQFSDFEKHVSKIIKNPEDYNFYANQVRILQQYFGASLPLSDELVLEVLGALRINSFVILDPLKEQEVGLGFYGDALIYNHSCSPNAEVTFDGDILSVRALTDMSAYHRDKVLICYGDLLQPTTERWAWLREKYFFECSCDRCTDDHELLVQRAVSCARPDCSYPVEVPLEGTPTCSRCGYHEYPASFLPDYNQLVHCIDDKLQALYTDGSDTVSLDLVIYQQQELRERRDKNGRHPILHLLNLHRVNLLSGSVEAALALQELQLALRFGEENLPALRYHYGDVKGPLGLTLVELGKLCIRLQRLKRAQRYLTEALQLCKAAFGSSHPIVEEDLEPLVAGLRGARASLKNPALSLKYFDRCRHRLASSKREVNWLYWCFGALILSITCLGLAC